MGFFLEITPTSLCRSSLPPNKGRGTPFHRKLGPIHQGSDHVEFFSRNNPHVTCGFFQKKTQRHVGFFPGNNPHVVRGTTWGFFLEKPPRGLVVNNLARGFSRKKPHVTSGFFWKNPRGPGNNPHVTWGLFPEITPTWSRGRAPWPGVLRVRAAARRITES